MDGPLRCYTSPVPIKSTTAKRCTTPKRSSSGERESQENDQIYRQVGLKSHKMRKSTTKNFMSPTVSAASKAVLPAKKILAERNETIDSPNSNFQLPNTHLREPSYPDHNKSLNFDENLVVFNESGTAVTPFHELLSRASSDWEDNGEEDQIASVFTNASSQRPYDPVTNYLSPRPTFLRYRPERRREFLLLHQESKLEEEEIDASDVDRRRISLDTEETTFEEAMAGSPAFSPQEDAHVKEEGEEINDEEADEEEGEDEEEEEARRGFRGVLKILVLGCVLILCSSYISSMNSPTPSPASQAMASIRDGYNKVEKVIFEAVPWESFELGNAFLGQRDREEMVSGFVELNHRRRGFYECVGEEEMVEAETTKEGNSDLEIDFQGQREMEEMDGFVEPNHWDFHEGVREEVIVEGETKDDSSGFGIEFLGLSEKEEMDGFVEPNHKHLYEGGIREEEEVIEVEGEDIFDVRVEGAGKVPDEIIEIMVENFESLQVSSTNSEEMVGVENKEAGKNWEGFGNVAAQQQDGEVEGDCEHEKESSEEVSGQAVENLELLAMDAEASSESYHQNPNSDLGDHGDKFSDKGESESLIEPADLMFGGANEKLEILEESILSGQEDVTVLPAGVDDETTSSRVLEHMGTESLSTVILGVSLIFFTAFSMVLGVLHWCRTAKTSSSSIAKLSSDTVMEEKKCNPLPLIERGEEAQVEKVVDSFSDYSVLPTDSVEDVSGHTYDGESRAPMVELLGEFVMEEISSSLRSTDMMGMSVKEAEKSKVSVSQDGGLGSNGRPIRAHVDELPSGMSVKEAEENSASVSLGRSLRSNDRPIQAHVDQSPSGFSSLDSPSYGSFTSQGATVKKEEGKKGETVVVTPVRRSSRLRNRGTTSS